MGSKKSKNGIFFEATEAHRKGRSRKTPHSVECGKANIFYEGRSAMNPKRFSWTPFIISTEICGKR